MANLDKVKLKVEVNNCLCWTSGVTISQLKDDIEELEKRGIDYVDISIYTYYDDTSIDIKTYQTREETDEEYNKRIAQQKANEERTREYELKQLEKLKAKYETK
jgi:hypothetical protein